MNFVGLEIKDDAGQITISRPKSLNALNSKVLDEFSKALSKVLDKQLKALIITGEGEKAFVAGADITEFEGLSPQAAFELSRKVQKIFLKLSNLPCVSLAAVNGFALGGGLELALSCDFILASNRARFGLPEVSLGLIPGYGGTQLLSRSIGVSKASYLALTGSMISAKKAFELGLVVEVLPPEDLISRAWEVASEISARSPRAVALTKQSLKEGFGKSLSEGLEIEALCFKKAFESEDSKIGVDAFLKKIKPKFKGK